MVSGITNCSDGEIFVRRDFYEKYATLYYPNRKFGDSLPGGNQSKPQICFTGFSAKRKAELKQIAKESDLWVTEEVRNHIEYLVCGSNAGPSKIAKAQKLGARIWHETDFLEWIKTK